VRPVNRHAPLVITSTNIGGTFQGVDVEEAPLFGVARSCRQRAARRKRTRRNLRRRFLRRRFEREIYETCSLTTLTPERPKGPPGSACRPLVLSGWGEPQLGKVKRAARPIGA